MFCCTHWKQFMGSMDKHTQKSGKTGMREEVQVWWGCLLGMRQVKDAALVCPCRHKEAQRAITQSQGQAWVLATLAMTLAVSHSMSPSWPGWTPHLLW